MKISTNVGYSLGSCKGLTWICDLQEYSTKVQRRGALHGPWKKTNTGNSFPKKVPKVTEEDEKISPGSISILFESICEGDLGQIDR